MEGSAIAAVLHLVTSHPVIIIVPPLRRQMCDVFAAVQISLEPLILIIVSRRPRSALPITCLKVQSPLYGRMIEIPLRRSRNLKIVDRAAFHSKRIPAFFVKKTAKQWVKLSTYCLVNSVGMALTLFRLSFCLDSGEVGFWHTRPIIPIPSKLLQWNYDLYNAAKTGYSENR